MSDLSRWSDLQFRSRSRSFILRVWHEELGVDCQEWRGQLRDVTTGEVHYFHGWPGLMTCLRNMLGDDVEGLNSHH